MLETMYAAPGIGLAAIQVGVPRRVVVLDVAQREDEEAERAPMFLINPEILTRSDEVRDPRGGLPVDPGILCRGRAPGLGPRPLSRPRRQARRRSSAEGVLAVCIQHEVDHLDGTLFIDYLSKLKRDMVIKKFAKQARQPTKSSAL